MKQDHPKAFCARMQRGRMVGPVAVSLALLAAPTAAQAEDRASYRKGSLPTVPTYRPAMSWTACTAEAWRRAGDLRRRNVGPMWNPDVLEGGITFPTRYTCDVTIGFSRRGERRYYRRRIRLERTSVLNVKQTKVFGDGWIWRRSS